MTNKYNNWIRILEVINYLGLNPNSFALHLGMPRSENIYHIKRGNYGISEDLADRIVGLHPEIDRTWLLTGVGSMMKSDKKEGSSIPCFSGDICDVLPNIDKLSKSGTYRTPYICDCDMVVRSKCAAMNDPGTAATDLFLKGVEVSDMVQGNEYAMIVNDTVLWRKIRLQRPKRGQRHALRRVGSPERPLPFR